MRLKRPKRFFISSGEGCPWVRVATKKHSSESPSSTDFSTIKSQVDPLGIPQKSIVLGVEDTGAGESSFASNLVSPIDSIVAKNGTSLEFWLISSTLAPLKSLRTWTR